MSSDLRLAEVCAWPRVGSHDMERGSGYLITDRLVLTAGHIVANGNDPCPRLKVYLAGGSAPGEVLWWRNDRRDNGQDIDAALVEITDSGWEPPRLAPARWGELTGLGTGVPCTAAGFPDYMNAPVSPDNKRTRTDIEQVTGTVNPQARGRQGMFDIQTASSLSVRKLWKGMSGAAVLCGDGELVTGVITEAAEHFSDRLTAVPLARLAAEPQFRELIEQHTGRQLRLEPVELSGMIRPWYPVVLPATPAALLRPEYESVRFRGRDPLVADLIRWCLDPGPLAGRILVAPGGQGKSRLARHIAGQLQQRGWVAGEVAGHSEQEAGPFLERLAKTAKPVLLIIDYAETRADFISALTRHAAEHPGQHAVRVLLLARGAGEWWDMLRDDHLLASTLEPVPCVLPALDLAAANRPAAFRDAVHDFAAGLESLPGYGDVGWVPIADSVRVPDLRHDRYAHALTLHMTALAALLQHTAPDDEAPEDTLLRHERKYWNQLADRRQLGVKHLRIPALTIAMLCGAAAPARAHAALSTVPGLGTEHTENDRRALAAWVHDLYPPAGADTTYWGTLQPDRLSEHFLITTIISEPALLQALAKPHPGGGTILDAAQLHHALTVLMRASTHNGGQARRLTELVTRLVTEHPAQLAAPAAVIATQAEQPQPLVAALDHLARPDGLPLDVLLKIQAAIPTRTRALAFAGTRVTGAIVGYYRRIAAADPSPLQRSELAKALNNHAVRLSGIGATDDALAALEDAVRIGREVAVVDHVHRPELAMALNNYSVQLASARREAEALTASTEAVSRIRGLAAARPDLHEPNYAMALHNHAVRLIAADQLPAALDITLQTVVIYRRLAHASPQRYQPALALALINLALVQHKIGHRSDALATGAEAVSLCHALAEASPDAYLPDLARALSTHAETLADANLVGEALAAAEEAVRIRQNLAQENPAHLADLGLSLTNYARRLAAAGRSGDALTASEQAVRAWKQDAHQRPLPGVLTDLADALDDYATRLASAGRRAQAKTVRREAADIRQRAAQTRSPVPGFPREMPGPVPDHSRGHQPRSAPRSPRTHDSVAGSVRNNRDGAIASCGAIAGIAGLILWTVSGRSPDSVALGGICVTFPGWHMLNRLRRYLRRGAPRTMWYARPGIFIAFKLAALTGKFVTAGFLFPISIPLCAFWAIRWIREQNSNRT